MTDALRHGGEVARTFAEASLVALAAGAAIAIFCGAIGLLFHGLAWLAAGLFGLL